MIIIVILAVAAGVMVAEGRLHPQFQTLEAEGPEWGEEEEEEEGTQKERRRRKKRERWTCGLMCFG